MNEHLIIGLSVLCVGTTMQISAAELSKIVGRYMIPIRFGDLRGEG